MALTFDSRNWRGRDRTCEELKGTVMKVLGPSLQMKGIETVYLISGETFIEPRARGKDFWVIINGRSHRREEMDMRIPPTMWGIRLDLCKDCGRLHEPSGDGLLIIDPKSGYAVAELIDNCLYILFNICDVEHLDSEARKSLQVKVFTEAIAFIGKPFPTVKEITTGKFQLPNVDIIARMIEGLVPARRDISQHVKHASELMAQLENFDKNAGASRAFKRILEIPEIDTMTVMDNQLTVVTHTMYAIHPVSDQLYELGRFQVKLTLGSYADAKFKNLDRNVFIVGYGDYGHPHVERAGNHWCMGEGAGIIRLLQQFEIEAAIVFALKAIESVNESTDGNYHQVLQKFPEAKSRKKYPAKKEVKVDDDEVVRFAKVCDRTFTESRTSIEKKLAQVRPAIAILQETIQKCSFYQKVVELCRQGKKDTEMTVTNHFCDQIAALKKVPEVDSVKIEGNIVDIVVGDNHSLRKITIDYGQFQIQCIKRNGDIYELPVSQLSATIPELVGGLDLETAIPMILESVVKK